MIQRLKTSWPGRVVEKYIAADAGFYATAIAYNALFSVFPILLALISLAGVITRDPAVFNQIGQTVQSLFPGDAATQIVDALSSVRQHSGLLGAVSMVGLFWAGSALFGALAKAFNRLYGVPDRPLLSQKLMAVGMILLFGILLLTSLLASAIGQFLVQINPFGISSINPALSFAAAVFSLLVAYASALVLFIAIYYFVPNVRLRLADVVPGALLGAFFFLVLMQVFPLYVRFFGDFGRFGNLFGFSFLVLTWLYFVAQVILLGASLNAIRLQKPLPRVL